MLARAEVGERSAVRVLFCGHVKDFKWSLGVSQQCRYLCITLQIAAGWTGGGLIGVLKLVSGHLVLVSLMVGSEVLMMFFAAQTNNPGPYKCQVAMWLRKSTWWVLTHTPPHTHTCCYVNGRQEMVAWRLEKQAEGHWFNPWVDSETQAPAPPSPIRCPWPPTAPAPVAIRSVQVPDVDVWNYVSITEMYGLNNHGQQKHPYPTLKEMLYCRLF